MPEAITTDVPTASSTTEPGEYELDSIGVEFEYPVAENPEQRPVGGAGTSTDLRHKISGDWPAGGQMTGDHVGAEIVTDIMDLHSDAVIDWYRNTIEIAEDAGFPFAETARGATNFGLHMHLSQLPSEKADFIDQMCREPWSYVFLCSSVNEQSCDPFRYGSFTPRPQRGGNGGVIRERGYGEPNHYEWRFPEPVGPQHFELIIEFLRTLEVLGPAEAEAFAKERVAMRDERLTPVRQYNTLKERLGDEWPTPRVLDADSQTRRNVSAFMYNLMEGYEVDL